MRSLAYFSSHAKLTRAACPGRVFFRFATVCGEVAGWYKGRDAGHPWGRVVEQEKECGAAEGCPRGKGSHTAFSFTWQSVTRTAYMHTRSPRARTCTHTRSMHTRLHHTCVRAACIAQAYAQAYAQACRNDAAMHSGRSGSVGSLSCTRMYSAAAVLKDRESKHWCATATMRGSWSGSRWRRRNVHRSSERLSRAYGEWRDVYNGARCSAAKHNGAQRSVCIPK